VLRAIAGIDDPAADQGIGTNRAGGPARGAPSPR
jgi:hypothetical protein